MVIFLESPVGNEIICKPFLKLCAFLLDMAYIFFPFYASVYLLVSVPTVNMEESFWDMSHTVLRGDDEMEGSFGFQPSQMTSFGNDASWLWGSPELFDSRPSRLFESNDPMFSKLGQSEPVSPSSVDTTPTASEIPVSTSHPASRESCHEPVSNITVSKRPRKSLPVPASTVDRNGRKKKYDAPPGVWRNSGGFISTVYINKKRVYGPLRREVADAVRDREEMLMAKSVINNEEAMRAFVQGMKERCGANRQPITSVEIPETVSVASSERQVSTASVRASSRPIRAAAKRNVFATFSSDSIDEEQQDEYDAEEPGSFPSQDAFLF